MAVHRSITITISPEMAELVATKVASGQYPSESDVVEEGLRQLANRENEIDTWLEEAVVPALDAFDADPSSGRSLEETQQELEEHMRMRRRRSLGA